MTDETIGFPFTGEETPLVLFAVFVGFFVLPWVNAQVVKWSAPSKEKAIYTSLIALASALAMELIATGGSFNLQDYVAAALATLVGSEVGYRKVWKPMAPEGPQPVLGAIPGMAEFGLGRGDLD